MTDSAGNKNDSMTGSFSPPQFEPAYSQFLDPVSESPYEDDTSPKIRAYPIIAWIAIFAMCAFIVGLQQFGKGSASAASQQILLQDFQAKYLIGVASLPGGRTGIQNSAQSAFNPNEPEQALSFVIITAEVNSAEAAIRMLHEIIPKWQEIPQHKKRLEDARDLIRVLEATTLPDYQPTQIPDEIQGRLIERHGWLGELVIYPPSLHDSPRRQELLGSANRVAATTIGVFICAGLGLLIGLALLTTWLVVLFLRKLEFRLSVPTGTGGLYAETFAIWFASFFAMNLLFAWLVPGAFRMAAAGVASAISLLALAWPVYRGVPWQQVRTEIGLTRPPASFGEPILGVAAYIGGLPILLIGILTTLLLMKVGGGFGALFAFADAPVHPIIEPIAKGTMVQRIQAIAVVLLIPITEEIMFRGVLYRHMREGFSRLGRLISAAASLLLSSLLFAAIHPQGVMGIPLLTTVAIILGVLREWRGSLLAPTVTHMVVNGVTTTMVILLFG